MGAGSAWNRLQARTVLHEKNQTAQLIAKQIEFGGPISISEYMRIANKAYYDKADPLGKEGDFITAPEVSQMFGELTGLWLVDIWLRAGSPANCHFVELGPGRGTLAADCLAAMEKFGFAPVIHLIEQSETLRAKQAAILPKAKTYDRIEDLPDDGPLLIVANEFFDALPIRQFISTHAGWRERVLARDKGSKFLPMPGSQPMDHIVPADLRNAPNHSIFETCPEASNIMYELASRLNHQGGVLLIIDYGYALPGLGSTLQAVRNHQFAEPFERPGEIDLTAHVNFLELGNLARMRDLRVNGPVGQGEWLEKLGINQRADMLALSNPERADEIVSARNRLVAGDQMGSLFKVMAISAQNWATPEGFDRAVP